MRFKFAKLVQSLRLINDNPPIKQTDSSTLTNNKQNRIMPTKHNFAQNEHLLLCK